MKTLRVTAMAIGATLVTHIAFAQTTTTVTTATAPSPPSDPPSATAPVESTVTSSGVLASQSSAAPMQDEPLTENSSPINRPLLVTSVLVLGGSYAASAIDALASGRPEDRSNLAYPIVGPWMDFANRNCERTACANGGSGLETFNRALLIADGVAQGLGALGIVTSFFIPERATKHWLLLGKEKLNVGPTMVGTGYGLGAIGRF